VGADCEVVSDSSDGHPPRSTFPKTDD